MTVETLNITSGPYTGNGLSDEYNYDFRITDEDQLIVYETDDEGNREVLVLNTDYTVSGVGVDEGGTVTRVAGNLPAGYVWYIRSNYTATQATAFASQGGFFPRVHESALDKLTFLIQQLIDSVSRSIRFSDGYSGSASPTLPDPEANTYPRWNAAGTALVNDPGNGNFDANFIDYKKVIRTYLTGETASLSSDVPSDISVDDVVIVNAYSSSTAISPMTWRCVSLSASLPGGATPGVVNSLSGGDLFVLNNGSSYFQFREVSVNQCRVSTIEKLRGYSGAVGFDNVYVDQHTNAGDGGHGVFRWVSGAATGTYVDNGGTIVVPTGGDGSAAWLRDVTGPLTAAMFGASESASASTNTTAINNLATACRSTGRALKIDPVATYYSINATVDFSNITVVDARGAELRGTFSGTPAAIVGGSSTSFNEAWIYVTVRNTTDQSTTTGTYGIKLLNASNSDMYLGARGFESGVYFDGTAANRVWVSNRFYPVVLYNNGNQVFFDMSGSSYAVKNEFIGGTYYMGVSSTAAARGTVKLNLQGTSLVSDIIFDSPEIGISGTSVQSDHGVFFYVILNTTQNTNSVYMQNARFEGYNSWSASPYAVNIATVSAGKISGKVELEGSITSASTSTAFQYAIPTQKECAIVVVKKTDTAGNSAGQQRVWIPDKTIPYQDSAKVYVPGRVLYDATYGTPVSSISTGVSGRLNRALGDGTFVVSSTNLTFGRIFSKSTSDVVFARLFRRMQFVIVCWDSAGNVLSGSAPYYAAGDNFRTRTSGVGAYEFNGQSFWLHKDVAKFYIGANAWSFASSLSDVEFETTYGAALGETDLRSVTARNLIASTLPVEAFFPVGTTIDGAASNGWRNTFFLNTTTSASAASGQPNIVVTTATGITAGDGVAVELDTAISGTTREYQFTTVASVAGSTVTLSNNLVAAVASGRTVMFNRWVAR